MTSAANGQNGQDGPIHSVPLLDLARQHTGLKEQILAAIGHVCDTGGFVLGAEVVELEKNLAEYCQAKHAVGCASGSDALLLALMALGIGPGDEVILPSFTFFATASAVTRLGARPVFADIEPGTFNIDPQAVERLITPATKAILPVHLFGQTADMGAIGRIAATAGVAVVEDAAQAIGAEFRRDPAGRGARAGSMGQVGCFSFYPTKNLGGAGDGGMLTTQSDELADRLRLLRGHGMRPRYFHATIGINSRLDSFQAAVLGVKLPHLDRWTAMRQANAQRYSAMLAEAGLDRVLGLPEARPERRHVWNQYVVRIPDGLRDPLRQRLTEAHIGTEIYYPLGLHQQECFRSLGYAEGALPETERAAREVLALPIFPELTAAEQRVVVDCMAAFFAAAASGHPAAGHGLRGPKFLAHVATRQKTARGD
jgi:dTDP-4-amino-4,6-dideoxygalactose transaminase